MINLNENEKNWQPSVFGKRSLLPMRHRVYKSGLAEQEVTDSYPRYPRDLLCGKRQYPSNVSFECTYFSVL
jgi:hypothetical protein